MKNSWKSKRITEYVKLNTRDDAIPGGACRYRPPQRPVVSLTMALVDMLYMADFSSGIAL